MCPVCAENCKTSPHDLARKVYFLLDLQGGHWNTSVKEGEWTKALEEAPRALHRKTGTANNSYLGQGSAGNVEYIYTSNGKLKSTGC